MKLKEEVELSVLLDYGFTKVIEGKVEAEEVYGEEKMCLFQCYKYMYELGRSRRGQHYYLFVGEDRNISVYASKPDGSGGTVYLDDVLLRMIEAGLIERNDE